MNEPERIPIISRYIDEHMRICELHSYMRDWLYMQPMCHDDGVSEQDLTKLREVRRQMAAVYAFMEGAHDVVDRSNA
jgi:hypothetical protein